MKWVETEQIVRFNEIDEWGIAWYGHYMAWFEVGRMHLLRHFDLLPAQLVALGYIAPVISLKCDYKHPARFDDTLLIRATAEKPEIAALTFTFEILHSQTRVLMARGRTTQVLMTVDKKMIYRLSGELEKRILDMVAFCMQE